MSPAQASRRVSREREPRYRPESDHHRARRPARPPELCVRPGIRLCRSRLERASSL